MITGIFQDVNVELNLYELKSGADSVFFIVVDECFERVALRMLRIICLKEKDGA